MSTHKEKKSEPHDKEKGSLVGTPNTQDRVGSERDKATQAVPQQPHQAEERVAAVVGAEAEAETEVGAGVAAAVH